MANSQSPQAEWWSQFPDPRAKCPEISPDEVMKMFDDMDISPGLREFLLIDVRRTDWEVSLQQHRTGSVFKELHSLFRNTYAGSEGSNLPRVERLRLL
jgi:hypothetical protein